MAQSLEPGGATHDLLLDILLQIQESNKRAEAAPSSGSIFNGITIKEAIALRVLGQKGLTAIAEGLGKIADVIDGMETEGKDAKEKMEALAEGVSSFQGLGKAIFEFAGYLLLATPLLMIGVLAAPLFALSLFIIVKALKFGVKPLTDKKTRKALVALGDVADGIFSFGWKLALSLLIYPFALLAMVIVVPTILLLGGLFYLLDKMGIKKSMTKTAEALKDTAISILALGAALAIFGLIFPPTKKSLMTLGMVSLVVLGLAVVYYLIGMFDKNIVKGARAMAFVALSIVALGVAIKLFEILMPADPWDFFLKLGVAIVGLGAVYFLAGLLSKTIVKGALAMALVGISLIVLGVGLFIMKMALPGWEEIGMILAIVGGLGIVMGLAGAAASFIIPGAGAMIVVGISLITLGIGTLIFAMALKDMTWEKVGMMAAIITGLGIAMTIAGAGAILIIPGAAAMTLAGIALGVVAGGTLLMAKVFEGSAWKNMIATHHESDGFLGFGGGPVSNLQTLMEAIGYSFMWNPISVVGILGGAGALSAAGLAMLVLAPGINAMSKIFEGSAWKNMVATHHEDEGFLGFGGGPVSNIAHLISQLGVAFNMGFSSLGIMAGATAMVTVGKSLQKLAFGIMVFMKTGIQPAIAAQIGFMVSAIATPFGVIGKKYGGGTGFFGLGPSPLMEGVRATQGMGKALTSIATGMVAMSKLRFPNYDDPSNPEKITSYTTLTSGDMNKVSTNVMTMALKLGMAFGMVGKMFPREPRSGILGLFGFTKPSPVQQGIASMGGMGEVLTSIAKGMIDMSKMKFPVYGDPNDPKKVTEYITLTSGNLEAVVTNVVAMVDALAGGFGEIGRKYPRQPMGGLLGFYGFSQKSLLGQGINATTGMGEVLQSIAKGMLDMAKMEFPVYGDPNDPLKVTDKITLTNGDLGAVVGNITFMIETIADAFASIGEKYGGWWFMDGPLKEGVEAMTEVGPVMTKILDPIKNFLLTEGVDMKQAPKDVSNLLSGMTVMFDKFAQIGSFNLLIVGKAMETFFNSFKNEDFRFGNFLLAGKEKGQAAIESITTMFTKLAALKNIDQTAKYLSIIGRAVAGMRSEETASFSSSSTDGFIRDSRSSSGSSSKKGYGEVIALVAMLGMPAPGLEMNARSLMMASMAYRKIGTTLPMGGIMLAQLGARLNEFDLESTAESMEKIANSYKIISQSSKEMEVEALKESTKMFEALAYLSEQGGEDAIEALGDELIEAIKKLALMIADFGGTVQEAKDGQLTTGEKIQKGLNNAADKVTGLFTGGSGSGGSGGGTTTTSSGGSSSDGKVVQQLRLLNANISDVLSRLPN